MIHLCQPCSQRHLATNPHSVEHLKIQVSACQIQRLTAFTPKTRMSNGDMRRGFLRFNFRRLICFSLNFDDRAPVDEIFLDGRSAGEFLLLRIIVEQYVSAMQRLAEGLKERAYEARREPHPNWDSARNFRIQYDFVVRQFLSSVDPSIGISATSIRGYISAEIEDFLHSLRKKLPRVQPDDYRRLRRQGATAAEIEKFWKERLEAAAGLAIELAQALQIYLDRLVTAAVASRNIFTTIDAGKTELRNLL